MKKTNEEKNTCAEGAKKLFFLSLSSLSLCASVVQL